MNQADNPAFCLFLFPTTTHVLWAEEVALEKGLPVEIVPAPPGHQDLCGLALRTYSARVTEVESLLEKEEIPFQRR